MSKVTYLAKIEGIYRHLGTESQVLCSAVADALDGSGGSIPSLDEDIRLQIRLYLRTLLERELEAYETARSNLLLFIHRANDGSAGGDPSGSDPRSGRVAIQEASQHLARFQVAKTAIEKVLEDEVDRLTGPP